MENMYIMTAFGKDRPGIVADVTELIFEYDFNLEDSKMVRLLDEFAIILSFSGGAKSNIDDLNRACRRLEREKRVSAYVRSIGKDLDQSFKNYSIGRIHVEGLDHAGIVYKVSKFLADENINIDNLESEVVQTPESGTKIYKMDIYIQLTPDKDIKQIESGLDNIAEELNLDITISMDV